MEYEYLLLNSVFLTGANIITYMKWTVFLTKNIAR
jgi:hypothetical protein